MATKRVRLTDPRRAGTRRRRAVEDSTPYPGTVNQPGRTFRRRDEYDMDWETTNHPYPDMRHDWKSDSRDEIGFGIPEANAPTVASLSVAASKAVRAALLLLGEKVDDEVIESQARDFMALEEEALDRTLQRFVESQGLYVAEDDDKKDEEPKKDEGDGDKEASAALADKNSDVPASVKEPKRAEESKKDESKKDEEPKKDASDEKKDEDEKKDDDKGDGDKEESDKKDVAASGVAAEQRTGPTEMDIELTSASGMDLPDEADADPRLAQLFEDESIPKEGAEDDAAKPRKAKAGIKELGGQPRAMTAGDGVADIGSIWDTAPDVSSVFR